MKKKYYLVLIILTVFTVKGQVGINTTTPQTTLDVTGTPATTTVMDGIIPPRLTGNQLQAKTYTAAQNGAIVYVTQASSSPSGQVINVTSAGVYVFDSSINQWIALSNTTSSGGKNVFSDTDDPNSATIFDDENPVVTNDITLIQDLQNTYYGLDGSVWIWNGTAYITYAPPINLNIGQRASVYRTMSATAADGTHLPATGLIELDGLIRIGLNRDTASLYKPYIQNISSATINVTFASGNVGATAENRYVVQASIAAGATQGLESNDLMYWSTLTETLTADVILPNGKWYEIQWMAFEVGAVKQIYMTTVRKF